MSYWGKLHKWLGLILALQVLIWIVTGSLMSLIDAGDASGSSTRRDTTDAVSLADLSEQHPLTPLPPQSASAHTVRLLTLLSRPYYRLTGDGFSLLFDAWSGKPAAVNEAMARGLAQQSYTGEGQMGDAEQLVQGALEVQSAGGPLWRVYFSDALDTRVYVSASDGRILAHRNDRSELVDFLLMLHFMDYLRTDNFNNPQIIVLGFGTVWLALSGLVLLFTRFSRRDFRWLPRPG